MTKKKYKIKAGDFVYYDPDLYKEKPIHELPFPYKPYEVLSVDESVGGVIKLDDSRFGSHWYDPRRFQEVDGRPIRLLEPYQELEADRIGHLLNKRKGLVYFPCVDEVQGEDGEDRDDGRALELGPNQYNIIQDSENSMRTMFGLAKEMKRVLDFPEFKGADLNHFFSDIVRSYLDDVNTRFMLLHNRLEAYRRLVKQLLEKIDRMRVEK